ncbi:hypothetical protein PVK06_020578 [Gossypium arboreum]|uniref:Uncharacterized protein n=1 Tax=Gossypium arboreum TaxID=29729 RepID=A0ABR0PMY8_GOSAR|nr:hypothetical protein PVK06_020578 [Gossypium arboreum]
MILNLESEVSVVPPTSGSNNLELGIEALTRLVREVLEKEFEARIKETSETLQDRCVDNEKKRDHSPSRLEPHSMRCVKTHFCVAIAVSRRALGGFVATRVSTRACVDTHGRVLLEIRVSGLICASCGRVADLGILSSSIRLCPSGKWACVIGN